MSDSDSQAPVQWAPPAFLADEDFNNNVVRGLRRRRPDVDLVRLQDVGLIYAKDRAKDAQVLEWAATEGRVVLTRDVTTMTKHANDRVAAGLRMPGVFAVRPRAKMADVISSLVDIVDLSREGEWEGKVGYLPL